MSYSLSQKDKLLSFIMASLLIATGVDARPVNFFLDSSSSRSHISIKYPLYSNGNTEGMKIPDTPGIKEIKHLDGPLSRYIRREKNSDLVIAVPGAENGKYRIRFFDEEDRFLFEIRQIRDSILIVEKLNFQHAGLFQYELYRGESLVERNTFIIKKD